MTRDAHVSRQTISKKALKTKVNKRKLKLTSELQDRDVYLCNVKYNSMITKILKQIC